MKVKPFPIVIGAIVIAFGGAVVIGKINRPPEPPRPGIEQADHGREHVSSKEYGGDQPPTSGSHVKRVKPRKV